MSDEHDEAAPMPAASSTEANPYLTPVDAEIADIVASDDATSGPISLPHPHIGWACVWILGFLGLQLAVGIVVGIVALVVAAVTTSGDTERLQRALADTATYGIPIGTLSSVVFAGAVALIMFRRHTRARLALRGMDAHQWILALLSVLPVAVLASEVTNWAAKGLPQFNGEVMVDFARGPWWLVLLAGCVFPAVGEEIFCRGFLGRGLVAWHGGIAGVLLASFLFGAMHIDPVQATGAACLGLWLHAIYLATRSLLAPILVHLLNNALAFWLYRNHEAFPLPGLSPLPDGTIVHTPLLVVLAALAATFFLATLLYQTRTRWIDATGKSWSPGYLTAEMPTPAADRRAFSALPNPLLLLLTVASYAGLIWALLTASHSVAL